MRARSDNAACGFTLIELSIVLVIIGLVVGGVLVGHDLIHAAEIRATVAQAEKFNAAVNTFRNKYNCLPGDCPNGDAFGFDPSWNGNGDSYIGLCNASASCRYPQPVWGEARYFWYHLSAAGLIKEYPSPGNITLGTASPKPHITAGLHDDSSGWGIIAEAPFDPEYGGGSLPVNSLVLGSDVGLLSTGRGYYRPADIYAIDSKMDDGLPLSGSVRAFVTTFVNPLAGNLYTFGCRFANLCIFPPGPGGSGTNVCVRNDVSPSAYNVNSQGDSAAGLCGAVVRASF